MIKIRQILRLHSQGCSKVQIAARTGISRNTLKKYLKEFTESMLSYDAILDRIIHNAHRIELKGESLRKRKTVAQNPGES